MTLIFLTIIVFGAAILLMSIGVLFKRGCFTGSCGGMALLDTKSTSIRCLWCPYRERESQKRRS